MKGRVNDLETIHRLTADYYAKIAQKYGNASKRATDSQTANGADVNLCARFQFQKPLFIALCRLARLDAARPLGALWEKCIGLPGQQRARALAQHRKIRPAACIQPLTPPGFPGDVGARGKHKGSQCHQGGHDLSLFHEFQPPFSLGSCVIR